MSEDSLPYTLSSARYSRMLGSAIREIARKHRPNGTPYEKQGNDGLARDLLAVALNELNVRVRDDGPGRREGAADSDESRPISWAEAATLHAGSFVIECREDGTPLRDAWPNRRNGPGAGDWSHSDYTPYVPVRVLYRAPELPKPVAVGDVLTTCEDFERARERDGVMISHPRLLLVSMAGYWWPVGSNVCVDPMAQQIGFVEITQGWTVERVPEGAGAS